MKLFSAYGRQIVQTSALVSVFLVTVLIAVRVIFGGGSNEDIPWIEEIGSHSYLWSGLSRFLATLTGFGTAMAALFVYNTRAHVAAGVTRSENFRFIVCSFLLIMTLVWGVIGVMWAGAWLIESVTLEGVTLAALAFNVTALAASLSAGIFLGIVFTRWRLRQVIIGGLIIQVMLSAIIALGIFLSYLRTGHAQWSFDHGPLGIWGEEIFTLPGAWAVSFLAFTLMMFFLAWAINRKIPLRRN
ncbi:hypothetical protein ACTOVL_07210 [Arcanobacterium canis]